MDFSSVSRAGKEPSNKVTGKDLAAQGNYRENPH